MTAEMLNARGAARAIAGDWPGAFADYDAALALNPQFTAALNNRAVTRLHLGDLDAALEDLRTATRIDPTSAEAYLNCAAAEIGLFQHAQAVVSYDRAIALYSRNPRYRGKLAQVHVYRGIARYHLQDAHGATSDLRAAYRLDAPRCVHTVLQILLRNTIDLEGAIRSCTRYLARDPSDVFTLVRRALTNLLAGHRNADRADQDAIRFILSRDDVVIVEALREAVRKHANHVPGNAS